MVLISHTSSRIKQVYDRRGQATFANSKNITDQCCVAMHLTGIIFNSLCSKITHSALKKQLTLSEEWPLINNQQEEKEISPKKAYFQTGDQILKEIIDLLLELLSITSSPWMYDAMYYATNLLLSMLSTQLYKENVGDDDNIVMEYMYKVAEVELLNLERNQRNVDSSMIGKLLKSVLSCAITLEKPPRNSLVNEILSEKKVKQQENSSTGDANVVVRFIQTIYNFIGTSDNKSAENSFKDPEGTSGQLYSLPRQSQKYSLQEKMFSLYMVLLYNRKNHERGNSFREVFRMLQDMTLGESEEVEGLELVSLMSSASKQQMMSEHVIFVDFRALANNIEEMLPSENTTLFLYALLHIHPSFIDFLTSSRCIESVFCGILHGLYDSSNAACIDHLYILVTNVLVVVQDKMLRQSLSHMKAIKAPWYVEHKLIDTSVADLTMLCTLRCTLHALFKLKDSYLLSNCFAVMIDLAPVLQEIDIYVSERIVKVIYQLAKRSILSDSASASTTTTPSEADVMSSYLLGDVSIAINSRETLGVLLKVCALALHPSKRSRNVHLLYALIHEYEK
jgi:hypothetical protein